MGSSEYNISENELENDFLLAQQCIFKSDLKSNNFLAPVQKSNITFRQ
jgi:hypothetical protein